MVLLELSNIDVSYGQTPILKDLSLDVEEGDTVALMGRNGVGKTTLMRTIIGLLTPTDGSIVFKGEDVTAEGADRRARMGMGYVPQGRDIFPRMTVRENLRMGHLVNESVERQQKDKVYDYFPRLKERSKQRAGTMSGGEQQMLAIGRALIGNPSLLLLDEPSEGVQPNIVNQISETVQRINEELGTTVFFVEQNLKFTMQTAEYCYIMEKGTIVDGLKPAELEESDVVQKYLAV